MQVKKHWTILERGLFHGNTGLVNTSRRGKHTQIINSAVKRSREDSIKALNEAIKLYKEGSSIKDITAKTNVDLKKLYSVLRIEGLKRYNKASKAGPNQRIRL